MNSIKNAIVTVTLLAVGYGAFVVLNSPPEREFDQIDSQQGADISGQPTGELPTVLIEDVAVDDSQSPDSTNAASDSMDSPLAAGEVPATLPSGAPPGWPLADQYLEDNSTGGVENSTTTVPPRRPDAPVGNSPSTPNLADSRFSDEVVDARQLGTALPQSTAQYPGADPPIDISLGPVPSDNSSAGGSGPFEQTWQSAEQLVRENNFVQALATLSPWYYDQTLDQQQRARCLGLLDQLAGTVVYSRQHLIEPEYEVQAGETLDEIASRYAVPLELLAKINGIAPPFALATGEKLKVVPGPFRAEISISSRQLTLFLGSYYAGRFAVRIGRDLPAQDAFYEVTEKSHGRSYFDRRMGREIMTGETSNRYGDRWVGLRGDQITAGHSVGIHGRPAEAMEGDIGSISLDPFDAEDVFSILSIGSRVHVRR